MTFLELLTLLEISEIDKFMSLKAFICPFPIRLSLFPEPFYNNVNYQARKKFSMAYTFIKGFSEILKVFDIVLTLPVTSLDN